MNKLTIKLMFLAAFLLFAAEVMAQVPQGFNYQAIARNAAGDLIANSELGVRVSVLQGSETGTAVYTETQLPTTSPIGSFQIVIGEGTSEDDFSAIDWSSDNYFVKLEIDPAGGSEYEELGTTRLLSVPYALLAQNVQNGSSDPMTEYTLNTSEGDTSFIVNAGGTEGLTAIRGNAETGAFNRGLAGIATSIASNVEQQQGILGSAPGAGSGVHLGVFGSAINHDANNGGTRYGVYGQGGSKSKYNYGVSGFGTGEGNGDEGEGYGEGSINFGVRGSATGNSWNNSGIEAEAYGPAGKMNYGVSGLSNAGSETTTKNFGVAGRAYGPGINYGIYGTAWDGAENYAGFFDGKTVVNGNLTVNGDINHTGSVNNTSDRNLKENIQPLQNGLATILKLNPATYNFRGNGEYNGLKLSTGLHYGLIAQEVEEVLPSLVKNNIHTYTESVNSGSGPNVAPENTVTKTMKYKTMNYMELIPVLIKGMQEQQEVIEQLKKEIEELKKQ